MAPAAPSKVSAPLPEITPFHVRGVVVVWLKPPPVAPSTTPRLASNTTLAVDERIRPPLSVIWSAAPGTIPIRVSPAKLRVPALQIHLPANEVCDVPGERIPVPALVTTP